MSGVGTIGSAIAVGFSFPIIDGIFVALRFYTRWQLKAERQLDDWLCIPAWLCLTGCCASLLTGVYKGAFDDAPMTDPEHLTQQEHILAQATAALVILWMGANFLIKLIMLFFYRRIFIGPRFNTCNWILIALSAVWFVYAIISWLFYCGTDFKANFEGGWLTCARWGFEIQMGVFAMDSFIDLCLLLLPIPFVWRLQLDLKRKIAVSIVFILGGFAFVAGLNNTIIQLAYLTQPELAESGNGANFFQGSSLLFSNWPAIEIGVGLLASNLPHLSFRIAHKIKESLPRALRLSINSLRHAAAALSLSSSGRHRHDHEQNHEHDHQSQPQQDQPQKDQQKHPYGLHGGDGRWGGSAEAVASPSWPRGDRHGDNRNLHDAAESTQGLRSGGGGGAADDDAVSGTSDGFGASIAGAKSLDQSSGQSADGIELRDLGAPRTGQMPCEELVPGERSWVGRLV